VIDHQPVQWINPNSFTINSNQFGTMGRNQLFGPGFSDVDFSVLKDTPITERVSTQFRIEIFNLFNRINLGSPTFTGANGIYSNVPYGGREWRNPHRFHQWIAVWATRNRTG